MTNEDNHCSHLEAATCVKCHSGYYLTNDHCCELGYYYNTNISQCHKIEDSYCSQVDDTNECIQCFVSDNFCDDQSNFFMDLERIQLGINLNRQSVLTSSEYTTIKERVYYYNH